jgi:thiol-disulfide isomerase/thioredoxin
MKNTIFIIFLILIGLSSCIATKYVSSTKPEIVPVPIVTSPPAAEAPAVNFSDQATWVLGYFKLFQIAQPPHSTWYLKGYDEYHFNTDAVNKLTEIKKDDLTIKIIMGTWCPDSRREVPRFIRILDACKFPLTKVQFIGVDNVKQSPIAEYSSLGIQRVPTFIFYKNNIEAGRIIENPVTSLEQDMVNILTRNEK